MILKIILACYLSATTGFQLVWNSSLRHIGWSVTPSPLSTQKEVLRCMRTFEANSVSFSWLIQSIAHLDLSNGKRSVTLAHHEHLSRRVSL